MAEILDRDPSLPLDMLPTSRDELSLHGVVAHRFGSQTEQQMGWGMWWGIVIWPLGKCLI